MSTIRSSGSWEPWVVEVRSMRVGGVLSLLTLLLGFSLGGIFGLFEDSLKAGFEKTALQTLAS